MKLPTENELRDLWLQKYHNTNSQTLIETIDKEILLSPEWFKLYPCTQEQHDEWIVDAKKLLNKKYKLTKKYIEKGFWYVYLNCSPYVSKNDNMADTDKLSLNS